MKTLHPSTLEGIQKYLGSGMVPGIGPHFAKSLVQAFGDSVFDVIESDPQKLRTVPGIGIIRATKITEAWKEQKVVRDIMVFLQSHGVSTLRAVRIYKAYGQKAVAKVKENPYQLARDITGIGFKSADKIAGNLGIPKTSLVRARAGLHHALFELVGDGHCAYPTTKLIDEANKLLEIEPDVLSHALELELGDRTLIRDTIHNEPCIYPVKLHRQEYEVAHEIATRSKMPPPWGALNVEKALEWAESKLGLTLAPSQKTALAGALQSKVFIITGGPGTGKTTITRALVAILCAKHVRLSLCSPTGRAAKRLSECTGREAKTIHRLLGVQKKKPGFAHNADHPLETDLVIVDEVSMVDLPLLHSLLQALPPHAGVLFIGDADQLPSVGPGECLRSLTDSGVLNVARLTEIFRQAAWSRIITNAHRINHAEMPELTPRPESDFHFVESNEPDQTTQRILEIVCKRIPEKFKLDPFQDIQVLCPMNRGGLGTSSLNTMLQSALNPKPLVTVERYGIRFATGDKVMVTQNDYDKDVFNGDVGIINTLDVEEQIAEILFDDRIVEFPFSDLDILSLAYAISVHKSQGSEYPAVVIPVTTQHFLMLKRNLLYTAITRGKKLVVLIGQKKALAIAVKSKAQGHRWNNLAHRLREILKPSQSTQAPC
jgi:exodeoxyribonuclease V alpha subunit